MGLRNVTSHNLKNDGFIAVYILFAFHCLKKGQGIWFLHSFQMTIFRCENSSKTLLLETSFHLVIIVT